MKKTNGSRILIFYDTVFGSTKKIAEAIAEGFRERGSTVVLRQADEVTAADVAGADLIVAGSPTRAFRATPKTMAAIADPAFAYAGKSFAAFDTRIDPETIRFGLFRRMIVAGGYAADRIRKAFGERGAVLLVAPRGFFVAGDKGTMLPKAEAEAAFDWARTLSDHLSAR